MLVQGGSHWPLQEGSHEQNLYCNNIVPPLDLKQLFSQSIAVTAEDPLKSPSSSDSDSDNDESLLTEEAIQNNGFAEVLEESSDEEAIRFARMMYPNATEVRFQGELCTLVMLQAATDDFKEMTGLHLKAPIGQCYSDITCECLIEVIRQHPNIQALSLRGIPNLTREHLSQILRLLSNLKSLELGGDIQVSDDLLKEILEQGHSINNLSLMNCEQLTADGWSVLSKQGSRFIELSLNSTDDKLPPELVTALFHSLINIKELTFLTCVGITDEAMKALAEKATVLTRCHLDNCKALSLEGLQALSKRRLFNLMFGGVKADLALTCSIPYKIQGIEIFVNGIQY